MVRVRLSGVVHMNGLVFYHGVPDSVRPGHSAVSSSLHFVPPELLSDSCLEQSAEDYIKHVVYNNMIVRKFDSEPARKCGAQYATLRCVFTDEEER